MDTQVRTIAFEHPIHKGRNSVGIGKTNSEFFLKFVNFENAIRTTSELKISAPASVALLHLLSTDADITAAYPILLEKLEAEAANGIPNDKADA